MPGNSLSFNIFGNDVSGSRALSTFGHNAEATSTRVAGSFKKIAGALTGAVAGLAVGSFLKDSVQGYQDHLKVLALTTQVVKTTGGAAKITASQVGALSDKIEAQTGVDGDLVLAGSNMLLTFTNIRNEVGKGNDIFNQATQTVTDMSVALGQDTKSSAIQLGKALNDPVQGITALSKVGVSFTADQKKQVAAMVKANNTLGAQKLILGELNREFGGAAKAAVTPAEKLQVAYHSLQDQVGAALLPVLTTLAVFLANRVLPAAQVLAAWLQTNLTPAFKSFGAWVQNSGLPALQRFSGWIQANVLPVLAALWSYVSKNLIPMFHSASASVDNANGFFSRFSENIRGIGDSLRNAFNTFRPIIEQFVAAFVAKWGEIAPKISVAVEELKQIITGALDLIQTVINIFLIVVEADINTFVAIVSYVWRHFGDTILSYVTTTFSNMWTVIDGALKVISGIIKVATDLLHGNWQGAWDGLKMIVSGVWQIIQGLVSQALNVLSTAMSLAWTGIKLAAAAAWAGLSSLIVTAIGNAGAMLSGVGHAIITGLGQAIINGQGWVLDQVVAIPGKIVSSLGNVNNLLLGAGQNIVWGLIHGIESMGSELWNRVSDFVSEHVPGPVKKVLGIFSPSKVMADLAKWIPAGLAVGIEKGGPTAVGAMTSLSKSIAGVNIAAPILGSGAAGSLASAMTPPKAYEGNAAAGWPQFGGAGANPLAGASLEINVAGSVVSERDLIRVVANGIDEKLRQMGKPSLFAPA